eukprot:scaffold11094_cov135-Isochrysis_galbana.AAC.4
MEKTADATFLFPPPCACAFLFLASSPCAREVCLLLCWGIESPSPAKEGGLSCGGASNKKPHA